MSQQFERYTIDMPFRKHRLHTEHNVSFADVDHILRPILESHNVALSGYNPEHLSFQFGEKRIQLCVSGYEKDSEFESDMKFIVKEANAKKIISISNHCSIMGTEVLVDFLKAFQKEFPNSYSENCKTVYTRKKKIQQFHIDGTLMHGPAISKDLEDETLYAERDCDG